MNQKITRRVVLGTTLAALAAGPFIIRAIRRPKNDLAGSFVNIEEEFEKEFIMRPSDVRCRFFAEWYAIRQSMLIKPEEVLGSEGLLFPQQRDFSKPFQRKFRCIETQFIGNEGDDREITPGDLVSYSILEGELRMGDADANLISIITRKNETKYLKIDVARSRTNGVGIIEKKEGGNATVIKVEVDLELANVDQEKTEITTGIEETAVVQKGEIGELSFDVHFMLTPDCAKKVSRSPNLALLHANLYSLLYVPLPSTPAHEGSTVDFPVMALLRQRSPCVSYSIESIVSLNDFVAARVKPNQSQDEKSFRDVVLRVARRAYNAERDSAPVDMDERTFLNIIEKRVSIFCDELRERFVSNNLHQEENWFVDTVTGLIVCRKESFVRKYSKLGSCFVSRSFQVS